MSCATNRCVDKLIVESSPRCVLGLGSVDTRRDLSPMDGSVTHGTWVARGVEGAGREIEGAQARTGFTNRGDLKHIGTRHNTTNQEDLENIIIV